MNDPLEIVPIAKPVRGRIRPPGSKSITNRALVCAALASGTSTLMGSLDSEDTHVMIDGLGRLGVEIERSGDGRTLVVHGTNGRVPALEAELFCANSGTTIRFLTALVTLGHGSFQLDGIERMRQRPIGDLLDALRQLGANAVCELENNCPPVMIHANGLRGGNAKVRGDISSQYLSALLMVAPYAATGVELKVEGTLVSIPYVEMTSRVMQSFGAAVEATPKYDAIQISNEQHYAGREYVIEPDASAASYFFAVAAITGGSVCVEGLSFNALQGDVKFVKCLEQMGARVEASDDSITVTDGRLRGIEVDMNGISDTVQTLAVVALFADGPTTIRNVAHIRHKETDRIAAVATELRKLGANVVEREEGLTIEPGMLRGAVIDTYNDHRMAMSFALAGLRIPGVRIANPKCVEKTYPEYFTDLAKLTDG